MSQATTEQERSPCDSLHIHTDPQMTSLPDGRAHRDVPADDGTRKIGRVGILGANSMSIGIAMRLLDADIPVTVFDRRDALDQGSVLLRSGYEEMLTCGALAAGQRDRRLALFSATARFHHLKDCDVVIEAMSVDTETRKKFFQWLDETGKSSAIMVANATGPALDEIARMTRRASDVLGVQFSNAGDAAEQPVLVRGRETSASAFATVEQLLA